MAHDDALTTLRLKAGDVLARHAARGFDVEVVSGRVWLTLEDDPRDLFVAAGSTVGVAPMVRAVIEADGDAVLRLRARQHPIGRLAIALLHRVKPRYELREPPYAWVPG